MMQGQQIGSLGQPFNNRTSDIQLPLFLDWRDSEDEKRKCYEFKEGLISFQREMGVDNFKVPSIGGKELDLCKLFKAVVLRGGSQRVSNNKLWKEIVNQFEIPPSCTSASFTLRNHYNKCLLQYEKRFYQTQKEVDGSGLTHEGILPLQPGVPQIIDAKAQKFVAALPKYAGGESLPVPATGGNEGSYVGSSVAPSNSLLMRKNQAIVAAANYAQTTKAPYPLLSSIGGKIPPVTQTYQQSFIPQALDPNEYEGRHHNQPMSATAAASVNLTSEFSDTHPVKLNYTLAESKRLVLAFESRVTKEIVWALNTLTIFSCNTAQNLTLENQPYLLESMCNYLLFCIQNIESLNLSDPIEKKNKTVVTSVPSYIDTHLYGGSNNQEDPPIIGNRLEYRNFGMFTSELKKREAKLEEKLAKDLKPTAEELGLPAIKKSRGRKTKARMLEELNALDELRKKRKKLITVLHQEVSELELINHMKQIILIIRNLSFIRLNEHHLIKSCKVVDVAISLFVDLLDKEITSNCLDIITNLAKHIVLADVAFGSELVDALFHLIGAVQIGEVQGLLGDDTVDQCIECLRRLSLSAGNEKYLERLRDSDIQSLVNLLVNPNIETREGCLEILCTISDSETTSSLKVRIAQQQRCVERLIGLVACGSQTINEEKISKLAALTLANLNLAPANRPLIAPYEQELALIAASDESTCKIIAEILGDLDSFQVYAK